MAGRHKERPLWAEPLWVAFTLAVSGLFLAFYILGALSAAGGIAGALAFIAGAYFCSSRLIGKRLSELDQALAESRESLAEARRNLLEKSDPGLLLAGLPDPLLLIDAKGRVAFANLAAIDLFERELAGEVVETAIRDPELLDAIEAVLKGGDPQSMELSQPGRIQQVFSVHIVGVSEQGLKSQARRRVALLMLHDLTAAKRAEQLRADFVANASHELRTPLASLTGFIETLQGPARDDTKAREKFLSVMSEQAARMRRLIEDLLALSRIELAEHSPPSEEISLEPILRAVTAELEREAQSKGMSFTISAARVPSITGDRDELWRVFQNLIENAIKYGNDGSEIDISLSAVASGTPDARALGRAGVKVTIYNRGEGIPAEHIPRLTERFYRVDTARSRRLGGTGLGLAIVKHITNRHRGILKIESVPGQNVTVSCLFPEIQAKKAEETSPLAI